MNKPSKNILRKFAILIAIIPPLLFNIIFNFKFGFYFQVWTIFISVPMLLLGIFYPYKLEVFYKIWINFGNSLGWINSRIILTFIFFVILLPISILIKMFNYDPLRLKKKNVLSYKQKKDIFKIDLNKIF